ncbi:hypothetical protein DVH24_029011 [Malus domestica]|uniref:GH18 domain-containing protein n=1 Tax=Malus domestica TaxID=3750 RepID=A0A498HU50_MALDO|nr:hypothetical protein DVH24_029011 [Malus domestica]
MASHNFLHILLLLCSLMVINTGCTAEAPPTVEAAYYPSFSPDFPPSAINTSFFTHIFYAFLVPNNVTFKFDLSNSTALLLSNFTTTLRHKTPPVKTLLSIGGAADGVVLPFVFARLASKASFTIHTICHRGCT